MKTPSWDSIRSFSWRTSMTPGCAPMTCSGWPFTISAKGTGGKWGTWDSGGGEGHPPGPAHSRRPPPSAPHAHAVPPSLPLRSKPPLHWIPDVAHTKNKPRPVSRQNQHAGTSNLRDANSCSTLNGYSRLQPVIAHALFCMLLGT